MLAACRVITVCTFADSKCWLVSLSAVIAVGYTVTNVTVLESDGVATLTVTITMPCEADLTETSFFLLVNTLDATATGVPMELGV